MGSAMPGRRKSTSACMPGISEHVCTGATTLLGITTELCCHISASATVIDTSLIAPPSVFTTRVMTTPGAWKWTCRNEFNQCDLAQNLSYSILLCGIQQAKGGAEHEGRTYLVAIWSTPAIMIGDMHSVPGREVEDCVVMPRLLHNLPRMVHCRWSCEGDQEQVGAGSCRVLDFDDHL
jgi:hypothetical protein